MLYTVNMKIIVKPNGKAETIRHYWKECVGSGHASLGLRDDWLAQLKRVKKELGFKRVRFHGVLNDEMTSLSPNNKISFEKIGCLYDRILNTGMAPFVELSFMPESLSSGKKTIFKYKANVTPPRDYKEWGKMIHELTGFLTSRYGSDTVKKWFFEVWNEPNLSGFWDGNMHDYMLLYKESALAAKEVLPEIKIGGPATAKNQWIPEMKNFCRKEKLPLDFISTHHYPTDTALGFERNLEEELKSTKRGVLAEMTAKAGKEAGNIPLFYTEWNSSPSARDHYHDEPFLAAFVIKTIMDNIGITDIYSFWTFSDIFEETGFGNKPFHGGFGLLTNDSIPKPAYRAFQLLSSLGKEKMIQRVSGKATCESVVFRKNNALQILLYNHQMPGKEIKSEKVQILVKNADVSSVQEERIDSKNSNPKRLWKEMGAPVKLTGKQKSELEKSSELIKRNYEPQKSGKNYSININVPPHSVILLTVKLSYCKKEK